jgi:hypothetical protein
MKKQIILIVLISTVSISLFGQNFISEDKQWNVRLTGWAGAYSTEIYFIEGDSTLNSLNYKKVWASFDSGLYFVRLTFEDGLITTRKLIIN